MNNLEALLADHDSVLFDALDCDCCVYHSGEKVCIYDFDMCERGMREWLLAEHVGAQRDSNGTCPDGNETCPNHLKPAPLLRDYDEFLSESCNQVADQREHAETPFASKWLSNEAQSDSREKLEADALDFCTRLFEKGRLFAIGLVSSCDGSEQHDELIKLLDRQAAITERDFIGTYCHECQAAEAMELKRRIAELTDKIGQITNEASELMKKQPYTFDVHDVPGSLRTVGRYIDTLTAERDEWMAKAEEEKSNADGHWANANNWAKQVDEWKSKAEQAERAMNRAAGKWAKADTENRELTNQLESAHAKNRSLKAHISKMQEGRHGWHIKGKELQRQVDSLKRKLEAAQDVNERQDLEYISLVHEIGTLRAERDRYRELCGKLLDAADEMRRVRDAYDQFSEVDR